MFFPFQHGAMIGKEGRLPVVRPAWSLRTAFTVGISIRNISRLVILCLPLAVLWLWTEISSLNLADLTACFIQHIARIWMFVFERGVEDGVAFTSQTATSGIDTKLPGLTIPTAA